MKVLKVTLVSLLVLVVVLIAALVIFVNTFDINRFKPQIVSQASSALHRKVDFEKAGLAFSLRQGVSLRVNNLVIAEDSAFGQGNFFTVKDISLSIDVLGYIFHKVISISSATIDGPHITIIRQKDGALNVLTIAQTSGNKGSEEKVGNVTAPSAPMAVPAILVPSFRINNAEVSYIDHSTEPPLEVTVKDIQLSAKVTQSKIILESFSASLGGGSIKGAGSIDDYVTKQEFAFGLNANNVRLEELIPSGMFPVKIKGFASSQMQVEGQGFAPEAMTASLAGVGNFAFKNIVLEDINVFQRVMGKLTMIPGLTEKIEAVVPAHYKHTLAQNDTSFSDIDLPITIEHGRAIIKDMVIVSDMFSLKGNAGVGFDSSYTIEGVFLIPADLSAAMISGVPELQYLLNEDKNIFVPLKVSGKAGGAALNVDVGYLAKKLLTNQVKTQLIQAIDKAISKQGPNATSSSNGQGANSTISSVIGNIFKK